MYPEEYPEPSRTSKMELFAKMGELARNGLSMVNLSIIINISNNLRCSIKKAVLKIFSIFTGKHLFWSLLLIKLQASRHFLVNNAKFLGTPLLKNICEQLLLYE